MDVGSTKMYYSLQNSMQNYKQHDEVFFLKIHTVYITKHDIWVLEWDSNPLASDFFVDT